MLELFVEIFVNTFESYQVDAMGKLVDEDILIIVPVYRIAEQVFLAATNDTTAKAARSLVPEFLRLHMTIFRNVSRLFISADYYETHAGFYQCFPNVRSGCQHFIDQLAGS